MTVEGQDDARKIVTVLFADVTDSTLLGRELDPESVRRMMSRYFEAVSSALERHGGVVEKFIGDAVMAVFGVPRVHEDDALRAVRAAVEVRDVLRELNEEFERAWGVTVPIRTGVNTGEVIAGDPSRGQSFVVGDVVNMAARLEQAASAGEILIGEATYRLVREAVTAEQLPPLTVKGRAEPLQAWSVLGVVPGAPGWSRRLDSPLVDRIRELAMLEEMFERTAKTSSPHVVTAMGVAGVGKSRLTSEFLSRIRDRSVAVTGQCLPYGEGTTFWPVVSMLREVAQIAERDPPHEVSRKLAELLPAEPDGLVADRLAALLGAAPANPGIQETFWALRRLFESLGSDRPLVVVFDDVQWGETTFLDLLEYLADWIKDVPVLLVCLARPELHEVRPGWMTAKSNATSITLQPLSEAETDGLIQNLVGRAELVDEARKHIADVAEGNPLFVEETLRMLVDDGLLRPEEGGWRVAGQLTGITIPPTIHALLSARLDRLEPEERAVLERAAVVGRVFSWSAISELLQPDARRNLIAHLQALTRKELIRPDYSEARGEDAFRFAHILIRDAAYQGIRKATRAELHERLADWLATTSGDRAAEYDEIVGHHLERAHRLLLELGPITERVEELGRRAAAALGAAGRRAFARGDMPAAIALLSRATSLLDEQDRERVELLPQLAFALLETGDFDRLQEVVADATRGAAELGDPALEARAVILGLWVRL